MDYRDRNKDTFLMVEKAIEEYKEKTPGIRHFFTPDHVVEYAVKFLEEYKSRTGAIHPNIVISMTNLDDVVMRWSKDGHKTSDTLQGGFSTAYESDWTIVVMKNRKVMLLINDHPDERDQEVTSTFSVFHYEFEKSIMESSILRIVEKLDEKGWLEEAEFDYAEEDDDEILSNIMLKISRMKESVSKENYKDLMAMASLRHKPIHERIPGTTNPEDHAVESAFDFLSMFYESDIDLRADVHLIEDGGVRVSFFTHYNSSSIEEMWADFHNDKTAEVFIRKTAGIVRRSFFDPKKITRDKRSVANKVLCSIGDYFDMSSASERYDRAYIAKSTMIEESSLEGAFKENMYVLLNNDFFEYENQPSGKFMKKVRMIAFEIMISILEIHQHNGGKTHDIIISTDKQGGYNCYIAASRERNRRFKVDPYGVILVSDVENPDQFANVSDKPGAGLGIHRDIANLMCVINSEKAKQFQRMYEKSHSEKSQKR